MLLAVAHRSLFAAWCLLVSVWFVLLVVCEVFLGVCGLWLVGRCVVMCCLWFVFFFGSVICHLWFVDVCCSLFALVDLRVVCSLLVVGCWLWHLFFPLFPLLLFSFFLGGTWRCLLVVDSAAINCLLFCLSSVVGC